MYCVYRFLNKEGDVIYIGRTVNLNIRLTKQHFTVRGHLSEECYKEVETVEYANLSSHSEMKIYELYLINRYSPKYNVMESKQDTFKFQLPDIEWISYTGEKEETEGEVVRKLEKSNKRLQKAVKGLRDEKKDIQKEVDYLLVTGKRYLQLLDYTLSREGVDYDREDLVKLGLDMEYLKEKVQGGVTETRQEFYKRRGLGEEDINKILWEK